MEISKKEPKKIKKSKKNSNLRQLTNNEKVLITLLVVVILFWLGFKYIIEPQILKIETIETQINDYTLKIEDNNRMLNNWDSIVEQKNDLQLEKEEIEDDFFKSLSQPEIIVVLNDLLLNSNIEMESIIFSKPITEVLNEQEIQKMDISIPYQGDYKSLNEIIKEIEKESRKLIISTLNINKSDDTEIIGDINLGVYSLSGIVDGEESDIKIETTNDNTKNPFIPFGGYDDPNKRPEQNPGYDGSSSGNPTSPELGFNNPGSEGDGGDQVVTSNEYDMYKAVKGDSISLISQKVYGTQKYVEDILSLNGMKRSSILHIGKELKLIKVDGK